MPKPDQKPTPTNPPPEPTAPAEPAGPTTSAGPTMSAGSGTPAGSATPATRPGGFSAGRPGRGPRGDGLPGGEAAGGGLVCRALAGAQELDLFNRLPYRLNGELAGDLADGRRRPSWMWVALHGGRPVARLAWWARRAGGPPLLLDVFDVDDAAPDRVAVGERLLRTAMAAVLPEGGPVPQYVRFVPPGWRDDPAARTAVDARVAALERTGARPFVERLRLEWRAGTPLPEPSGRLEFRGTDRAEMIGLMTAVLDGTLDAHSRADLARVPGAPDARARVAAEQYDGEFRAYPSPPEWHRVGMTPGGEPVGFVVPARNAYHPILAYIGVLPAHRGRGYVDDLLAEGTRLLAAEGARRIRASTDVTNVPMSHAFARAGYTAFEHQLDLTWP